MGDVHEPFTLPNTLDWLKAVKELYQIPDENCIQAGDFLDLYHFSRYGKGADYEHTPMQEIEAVRKRIKEWQEVFPKLVITEGNHTARLWKKAIEAELPSVVIKDIREVFQYPKDWEVHQCVVTNTKHPFLVLHGDKQGISNTTLYNNPLLFGVSVAFGHFHSKPSIIHLETVAQRLWGMHLGTCGIDNDAYAFEYGKGSKFKPMNGCAIILDEGRTPIWIPMPEGK